jgi:hypothetical protein
MQKKRPDVDVILDVLKQTLEAQPASPFVTSLLFQYQERGGLSKKQLEGLHSKAAKISTISPGKLATLEAIILKKPTRYKSPPPALIEKPAKDTTIEKRIAAILEKFPAHKRVLFYKVKFENNESFSVVEKAELERFYTLLLKK